MTRAAKVPALKPCSILQDLHGLEGPPGNVAARRPDLRQKAVDGVGLVIRRQALPCQMGGDERRQLGGNGQALGGFAIVGKQLGVIQANGGALQCLHGVHGSRQIQHQPRLPGRERGRGGQFRFEADAPPPGQHPGGHLGERPVQQLLHVAPAVVERPVVAVHQRYRRFADHHVGESPVHFKHRGPPRPNAAKVAEPGRRTHAARLASG